MPTATFFTAGENASFVTDMPFAGIAVNTNWAKANQETCAKVVRIYTKAIAWLYDPTNRNEAVQILMKVSKLKQDDVERAYDYLIKGRYFEPTGKISKSRLGKLVDALRSLGDVPSDFTVERLFLSGITQVSD